MNKEEQLKKEKQNQRLKEWKAKNPERWKAIRDKANHKRINEFKELRKLKDQLLELGVIVPYDGGFVVVEEVITRYGKQVVK